MFLVFTLVLLAVAIGILASVYSVFLPFMQNMWTVQQYHQAYYGALTSLERASLVLKYREPWFEWSGGFIGTETYGPLSDYTPELLPDAAGSYRRIRSRTTTIPASGMGNVDALFAADDSYDYNQLWYTYLESFLLYYDNTVYPELYYQSWNDIQYFSDTFLTWIFRFPSKIYEVFWWSPWADLCANYVGNYCDPDGDGLYDDVAVSRSLEWLSAGQGFKIFPSIAVFPSSGMRVDEYKDNAIRESIINDGGAIEFRNSFSPVLPHGSLLTKHNVVSSVESALASVPFSLLLSNISQYTWLRISFGAANFFRTITGAIYPYLEYQFTFPDQISDRFFTIQGNGRVGEYDVQIVVKKPTVQWTIGGDFTVIF